MSAVQLLGKVPGQQGRGVGESVAETDEIPSSGINERFPRAVSEMRMCWTSTVHFTFQL